MPPGAAEWRKKMNKRIVRNKKGFTLIEIIVVLVIIAILVAAAIPAMIGFVDDARGKAYASEARVGLVAAQAVVTELVTSGANTSPTSNDVTTNPTFVRMTSDVTGGATAFSGIVIDAANSRVTGIVYDSGTYTITISGGTTTVVKN